MPHRQLLRTLLTTAAGITAIAGLALSPSLRDGLVALEPSLSSILFFAAGALALWRWQAQRNAAMRRRARRCEAHLGRFLSRWGWAVAVLCMLLPLLAHWQLQAPSGNTALAALLGYVPWNDARGHFEGGVRLLTEGTFLPYSERRPLNATWLAVLLAVTGGKLHVVLVIQATLLGLAAYVLARAVALRFGLAPALGAFALTQGLARDYIPTIVTEALGITLGCAALAILLTRGATRHAWVAAIGLFALSTALDARPGPQFLLPALLLWSLLVFRQAWRRTAFVLIGAAVLAALSTQAVNTLYGSGTGSFTSYPAYTLYGIARSSNWSQAEHDYGEELGALATEREVADFLYAKAFAAIRHEPGMFVRGLAKNELKFLAKLGTNLARVATWRALAVSARERARPSIPERRLNVLWGLPFLLAALVATGVWLARAAPPRERWFWLAALVGVLASVAFAYGDSGFRALATSYPFFAVFWALGLAPRRRALIGRTAVQRERILVAVAATIALGIVALSLVGGQIFKRSWPRPDERLLAGLVPQQSLLVSMERAPAVLVAHAPRQGLSHVPWVREREFLESFELAEFVVADYRSWRLPFALASVFDHVTKRQYLLVGPVDLLRTRGFVRVDVDIVGGEGWIARASALATPPPPSPELNSPNVH